jgi:hypothetical protein
MSARSGPATTPDEGRTFDGERDAGSQTLASACPATALLQRGAQAKEVVDRQQVLDAANAALKAAQYRVLESQHAMEASTHDVELNEVNIADNTLVAPTDGRIQYCIANIGEVLPERPNWLDARSSANPTVENRPPP